MDFKKYLNIDYNDLTNDKRGFVWGYDEDIFLKNTFTQAYAAKNLEFLREIKISLILDELPDHLLEILAKIRSNPPLVTTLMPVLSLTYKINEEGSIIKCYNHQIAIRLSADLNINPENDWILHSIIYKSDQTDGSKKYMIRYAEIPKLEWMIPLDIKINLITKN